MSDPTATDAIVIREMRPDEAGVVASHRRLAHEEAARYRGGDRITEDLSVPVTSGTAGGHVVLVALFRSTIVGSLIAAATSSDGEWTVVHVHVVEQARGAGAGDAMMGALVERLQGVGARWLGAHALPGDRESKNLYERQGMSARLIEVGRSLF